MLRRLLTIVATLVVSGGNVLVLAQDVKVVVSSQAGDRLTPKPSLHFGTRAQAETPAIVIDDRVTYQKIDGFGASLLEAGLMCINSLPGISISTLSWQQ